MNPAVDEGRDDLSLFGGNIEDNVVGTWFARLGVLAVLIGAAFGYRYAVDKGLIGPEARVAVGAFSGLGLIAWGHFARKRQWINFAHALSGGGIAIVYLAVLAAQFRFDLISPALALTLLTVVAVMSASLAIAYDSLPLAILTTLGAFMNPYFMASEEDPVATLSYLVGVDVGVVVLSFYKRWGSLNKLALVGTVAIGLIAGSDAGVVDGLGFATVFWTLFTVIPFIQVARDEQHVGIVDAGLVVSVAFAYLAAGLYYLDPHGPVHQGVFSLIAGGAYALYAVLAYVNEKTRAPLTAIMGALSVGFVALAAPLVADGATVHVIWSVEGAVLLYIGSLVNDTLARVTAAAFILVGLVGTIETMSSYTPDRLLTSPESIAIGAEVIVLSLATWLVRRSDKTGDWEPTTRAISITASLLTIGWLSQEARFEVIRSVPPEDVFATTHFVLSAVWAIASTVLVAGGVILKQTWARLLGLGMFGFTIVKMITVDLWLLEILQRTAAFVGLGVLMIGCSFMYNRFRDLIVGES